MLFLKFGFLDTTEIIIWNVINRYRTLTKNTFEQNFFKLLNNGVFGNIMDNVDKRQYIKIVCEWESRGKKIRS